LKSGAVFRAATGQCLVAQVRRTDTAWERLRGLLGHPPLADDQGLLIDPCPSVHTFGMNYPLDLAFLDTGMRVLKLVQGLPPRRLAACTAARATLELPPGAIERSGIIAGDILEWRPRSG
jgi:uncharacterized membrane protein (UPF0127 family)